MYRMIIFDLDGTLTDSKEGILNSLRYAFEKAELPVPPEETLVKFIGPPLQDSLREFCGLTRKEIPEVTRLFRERYAPVGALENRPAPGMAALCTRLKERGRVLALASSKPEMMCVPICERFGFAPSLTVIAGSPPTVDWEKADVIRETLRRLGQPDPAETLMVGDRRFDVEGSAAFGISCVGVDFFGYAAPGEMEQAGALAVFRTAEELEAFILSH